jgi:dipeptide transport system permease protein
MTVQAASPALDAGQAQAPARPLREFWYYFSENKGAVLGLALIVLLILAAIFADVIAPHDPIEQYRDALLKPPVWTRRARAGSCSAPIRPAATSSRA